MCILLVGLPPPPSHFTQVWQFFVDIGSYDDYAHDEERLQLVALIS